MRRAKSAVRGDEFAPLVSLSLESALVEGDYALLSVLRELSPDELADGLCQLERAIRENEAANDLDKLCSATCDRRDLLWLLHWFPKNTIFLSNSGWLDKPGIRSVEALFGITPRQLRSLLRQLNKLAAQVEMLNTRFEFGVLVQTSKSLYPLWYLQRMLRVYASLLEYASMNFAGNSHIYHNIAKARLTTYVRSKTGDFHDEEIAALISAVSDDENCRYDATSHRMWRRKHYRRLKMLDPALVNHGPITAPNSTSPSKP